MKVAVFDIGTNSIHMLMAELKANGSFELLGKEKEMVRLGDGMLSSGRLTEERMDLAIRALKKFKFLAETKGVKQLYAVATSAVRESTNGGDFLKRVYREIGLRIQVITGEEEGRLIYLGVKNSVVLAPGKNLILDIGGGSVEFILVDSQEVHWVRSLKIGSARLYEKFFKKLFKKNASPSPQAKAEAFQSLEKFLRKKLKPVVKRLKQEKINHVWATSGTFQNLASMGFFMENPGINSKPRSLTLEKRTLQKLYAWIKNSTLEQRLEAKGLDGRRVDIILSGGAIAWVLMQELALTSLSLSDAALREGLVYQVLQKNRRLLRTEAEIPNVRLRSVLSLAHRCDYNREHAQQVAKLSLYLFDKLQRLHPLSGLDRELLYYAALLHDIGYYISFRKHHRHAYYLIKNSDLTGFSEEEVELLALVSRYHRKSFPKSHHEALARLVRQDQERLRWMAALLRLADALDRSHFAVVDSLSLRIYEDRLLVTVHARQDAEYELWEAERRSQLLRRLLKRPVIFKRGKVIKNSPKGALVKKDPVLRLVKAS
ncbi:MAG: Ppx/GppA family phosphatase [Deltaproteobacteria bacterium]|nr:Ppx/GppA family phosphatase [Deltaproteobacteria bacterium]